MQVSVSARHGHLSEPSQAKIAAKVEKLTRIFDRLTAIDVVCNLEHEQSPEVEIRVSAEHAPEFVATDCSGSLMASVDRALRRLEGQLRKYKEKRYERHRQAPEEPGEIGD